MSVDLEPLLQKVEALAPRFGRARDDLQAMVIRAQAADYKGVMQNARLVLEALLRSLVTEDLKQTPGKAMLDELVTKFRQQANAGIVPTNILAHMGTVQAWGNLSAHDHAGSLGDAGVTVGPDEVVASLNSMVAILTWYADKKQLTPTVAMKTIAPGGGEKKSSRGLAIAGLVAVALAAVGAIFVVTRADNVIPAGFEALDAMYAAWKLPVPPNACRRLVDVPALLKSATDVHGLSLIDKPSAEASFLLARATRESTRKRSPALDHALTCDGFAAAYRMEAQFALEAGDSHRAQKFLELTRMSAPSYLEPRVTLAGLYANDGKAEAAERELNQVIAADPDFAAAYLVRAHLESAADDSNAAAIDLCRAAQLGSTLAKSEAETAGVQCTQP